MTAPAPPDLSGRLDELRAAGLYRQLRTVETLQGPRIKLDGREILLLCSNNYLGLAEHPQVRLAAIAAIKELGAGAGSSRLIAGNMTVHERLERRLAELHGKQSALLFGSGYLANIGVITSLAGKGDVVYSDELNHASIIDGCRLSGASRFVYRHRDVEHLAWAIERAAGRPALIVTDGLFSMDGDEAPIIWLLELARKHGARLMVDEAHAIGTIGPGGRGVTAAAGLEEEVDVITGTLGKSLGSYGAYACGSDELRETLVNSARSFIFSTGLPPAAPAAAEAALEIMLAEPQRAQRLEANANVLRDALIERGIDVGPTRSHIIPIKIGGAEDATLASLRALDGGVYAQAIRPPTVPDGTSRLRLSLMASHGKAQLREAAETLAAAVQSLGRGPAEELSAIEGSEIAIRSQADAAPPVRA